MSWLTPEIFGWISLVFATAGYIPYFYSIWLGRTRPHGFSWFIWGLLTAIAYFAQAQNGAGAGSWATGVTACVCLLVSIISLFKGEKQITLSDWLTFIAALAAIPLWYVTENAFYAVLLITLIDVLGFWPTFRKSWHRPHEEHPLTYFLSAVKFMLAMLALESFSWTTALYPASLVIMNGLFVIMVLYRRLALAGKLL